MMHTDTEQFQLWRCNSTHS